MPYLFSQCQAIHARSIVPCMDTPSVKSTYEAEVTVPAGMTCLMSAIGQGSKGDDEVTTFFYKQPVAIPSYLIAIVVGCLEKRDISDRCAVWAEPSVVDKAHWEFAETEDILASAEEIAGKYIWGRYDMVCLPPSFPFGGMENPCLTFLTPTLIAGDRSLVSVIAHEIAHSWSGNLVTNSSWEHFWLVRIFSSLPETRLFQVERGFHNVHRAQDLWSIGLRRLPSVHGIQRMDQLSDTSGKSSSGHSTSRMCILNPAPKGTKERHTVR